MNSSVHHTTTTQSYGSGAANDNAVRARVGGSIAFPLSRTPAPLLGALRLALSFRNPEFFKRQRMGLSTWNVPEWIECANETSDELLVPRGAVSLAKSLASGHGVSLTFEDRRSLGTPLTLGRSVQGELRDYQREATRCATLGFQGSLIMPCGAGKSVVGTAIIERLARSTLVIVHTHDLLNQWRSVLRHRLGIEAGVIAEGSVQLAPVTVATVQTLVRLPSEQLSTIGEAFGVVIVDECQHAPASTFQTVLAALPAKWRFGLTATPEREDGLTPLLDHTFGDRLFKICYQELVAAGYLQNPEVIPLYSNVYRDDQGSDYNACLQALVRSEDRNALIVRHVVSDVRNGHTVLVLSGRVDHCKHLASLLKRKGIHAGVLIGTTPASKRAEMLDEFRRGGLQVMIACTIADEGLDVPRLDRIVLAFPSRTEARTTQRLGRLMRLHPGKSRPVLYDIVDPRVPPLYKQFLVRRRLYKNLLGVQLDTSRIGWDVLSHR